MPEEKDKKKSLFPFLGASDAKKDNKDSFTFSDKIKNSKPMGSKSFANRVSSKIGSDGKPRQTLFERTRRDAPFFIAASSARMESRRPTSKWIIIFLRLPGDNMRILVEGKYRAQLTDMIHAEPYLFARAMELDVPDYNASVPRTQALVRQAHQLFEQFIDLAVKSGQENLLQGSAGDDAGELADFIAQSSAE